MSDFSVNARMVLAGPSAAQLKTIKSQIQNGVRGTTAFVDTKVNPAGAKQLARLRTELKNVDKAAKSAGENIEEFGRRIGIAGKRYLAFSVATVGVVKALGALRSATDDALAFEKQIIKIGQVSGRTTQQVAGLRDEILNISAGFGVSSTEISEAAVTLAQTGRSLSSVRKDLEGIAKANLSPTFGNAKDTVEGLIAVQQQFGVQAGNTVQILSKLNSVAGQFPVESADLTVAVKKAGGAFRAAGGDLDELLALFTAVRSTTRESADTIGTSFRTITGRLARGKTINFFKDRLGIDLVEAGEILKPFQALERISNAIASKGISQRSPLFAQIVEELGGIRQRAKVIPLLTQMSKAERVLNVSRSAGNSITKDAEQAQEGLAVQVTKVRQEFQKLVDNVLRDPAFRSFASGLLDITKGLIRVADAARPLIPLIGSLGGFFALRSFTPLLKGLGPQIPQLRQFNGGGSPGKKLFEGTGKVPGTGNQDDTPALIKSNEFVIRSQAHVKYGTKTMEAINEGQLPANFADDLPRLARGGSPRRRKLLPVHQAPSTTKRQGVRKRRGVSTPTGKSLPLRDVSSLLDVGSGGGGEGRVLEFLKQGAESSKLDDLNAVAGLGSGGGASRVKQLLKDQSDQAKIAEEFLSNTVNSESEIFDIIVKGSKVRSDRLSTFLDQETKASKTQELLVQSSGQQNVSALLAESKPKKDLNADQARKKFGALREIAPFGEGHIEDILSGKLDGKEKKDLALLRRVRDSRNRPEPSKEVPLSRATQDKFGLFTGPPNPPTNKEQAQSFLAKNTTSEKRGLAGKFRDSLSLGQGGGLAAGLIGAGAAASGGLFENETIKKVGTKVGGLAIQFGVLNQALQQSKPLIAARADLEQKQIKLQRANKASAALGIEEQNQGAVIGAGDRLAGDIAKKKKDIVSKLDPAITKELEAKEKVKQLTKETKALEKGGLKSSGDQKKLAQKQKELAKEEGILAVAKKNTAELKKQSTTHTNNLKQLEKENAANRESLSVIQKKNAAAKAGVVIGEKRVKAAAKEAKAAETRTNVALFGSIAASAAGSFFSDSGNEKLARGDASGVTESSIGGALQGAGTGAALGALFGPATSVIGGLVGGFSGLLVAVKGAENGLRNFKDEAIKAFGEGAKNQFTNDKGQKFDRELIDKFSASFDGIRPEEDRPKSFGRAVGDALFSLGSTLTGVTDDGNTRKLSRETDLQSVTRNVLGQEKRLQLAPNAQSLRKNLLLSAETFVPEKVDGKKATPEQAAEQFVSLFNKAIKASTQLNNPETSAAVDFFGNVTPEQLAAKDAAREFEESIYRNRILEASKEAAKTAALAAQLRGGVASAQSNVFDFFDSVNTFIAGVRANLSQLESAKSNLSFLGTGKLSANQSIVGQVNNFRDLPGASRAAQAVGLTARDGLNKRVSQVTGAFGPGGAAIGASFAELNSAVPSIKNFAQTLNNTDEIDEDTFNQLQDNLLKSFSGDNKEAVKLALDKMFDIPEGGIINGIDQDIRQTVDGVIAALGPVKPAVNELAGVFAQAGNELAGNLARSRALFDQVLKSDLDSNSKRQQGANIVNQLLKRPKTFTGDRANTRILTGGQSPLQLGNVIRGANRSIAALDNEQKGGVSRDRLKDIQGLLSAEFAIRDKAMQGLKRLGDVSLNTAEAVQKFNQAEKDRLASKSVLEKEAFGTPAERAKIQRQRAQLKDVSAGTLNAGSLGPKQAKELFEFAKGFGDANVKGITRVNAQGQTVGVTGNQLADKVLLDVAREKGLGTKGPEQQRLEALEKTRAESFKKQTLAQKRASKTGFGAFTASPQEIAGDPTSRRANEKAKVARFDAKIAAQRTKAEQEANRSLKETITRSPAEKAALAGINQGTQAAVGAQNQQGSIVLDQANDLAKAAKDVFDKTFQNFQAKQVIINGANIQNNASQGQQQFKIDGQVSVNVNVNGLTDIDKRVESVSQEVARKVVHQGISQYAKDNDMPQPIKLSASNPTGALGADK